MRWPWQIARPAEPRMAVSGKAMELEMASYADWIRVERRLSSSLRALARWGFVDSGDADREKKAISSGITPTGRPSRWAGSGGAGAGALE